MAAARAGGRHEREITLFTEGELWCSDEAEPAFNPAGWYFRPRRSSQRLWIGPFLEEEHAIEASFSGDALHDARKYLDRWRRGEQVPARPRLTLTAVADAKPTQLLGSQFELELDGRAAAPTLRRRKRRTAGAPSGEQLTFPLPK